MIMVDVVLRISNSTINAINIYRQAADDEKFIDGIQIKVTPTQKEAIRKICAENRLDLSTFGREAVDCFIDLFPYKDKIKKHHRLLRQVLDGLS
jgi:hypothetical protein